MENTARKTAEEPASMQVVKNDEASQAAEQQRPVMNIEQKIQKVADLQMLIDKYTKLTEARRNLQSFKLGTDGMNIQVKLRDLANNTDFTTSHSSVVQVVIADMQRILEEKICEVERLIEF